MGYIFLPRRFVWKASHGHVATQREGWGGHFTEKKRTDTSAMVYNWSKGVHFLMTFSWLNHYFLMTISRLSHHFLVTFSWLSHDFIMTFSWLSHYIIMAVFKYLNRQWFVPYQPFFLVWGRSFIFLGVGLRNRDYSLEWAWKNYGLKFKVSIRFKALVGRSRILFSMELPHMWGMCHICGRYASYMRDFYHGFCLQGKVMVLMPPHWLIH